MRLDLDVKYVRDQITALLLSAPELDDDDVLREDMIEAETNLDDLLTRLIRIIDDAKAMIEGTRSRMDELQSRRDRMERRIESCRSLIMKLLQDANLPKRILPEATLSIRAVAPKLIITDETAIPRSLCKIIYKPDPTKIREFMADGSICPGAEFSNGGEALAIRVK